jgi:hypothetical protein
MKTHPKSKPGLMRSEKSLLAILWNPHGFHVVTMLRPGDSFNASWLVDGNFVSLAEKLFPAG